MSRRLWLNTAAVVLVVWPARCRRDSTRQGCTRAASRANRRSPSGRSLGVDRSYMDPTRLALQGFLCLRQRRLRQSADPRRVRRLRREPGNRRTQLRHPQGNPREFGAHRRTQGERRPARRRFLRVRHGRGGDRPRRIAAARAVVGPHFCDRRAARNSLRPSPGCRPRA